MADIWITSKLNDIGAKATAKLAEELNKANSMLHALEQQIDMAKSILEIGEQLAENMTKIVTETEELSCNMLLWIPVESVTGGNSITGGWHDRMLTANNAPTINEDTIVCGACFVMTAPDIQDLVDAVVTTVNTLKEPIKVPEISFNTPPLPTAPEPKADIKGGNPIYNIWQVAKMYDFAPGLMNTFQDTALQASKAIAGMDGTLKSLKDKKDALHAFIDKAQQKLNELANSSTSIIYLPPVNESGIPIKNSWSRRLLKATNSPDTSTLYSAGVAVIMVFDPGVDIRKINESYALIQQIFSEVAP